MKKKMPLEHLRKVHLFRTVAAWIDKIIRFSLKYFTKTKDKPVNGMTVSIDVSLGR